MSILEAFRVWGWIGRFESYPILQDTLEINYSSCPIELAELLLSESRLSTMVNQSIEILVFVQLSPSTYRMASFPLSILVSV